MDRSPFDQRFQIDNFFPELGPEDNDWHLLF